MKAVILALLLLTTPALSQELSLPPSDTPPGYVTGTVADTPSGYVEPSPVPGYFVLSLAVGPTAHTLLGVPMIGGDVDVFIGVQKLTWSFLAHVGLFVGETSEALRSYQFRWGIDFLGRYRRLQFGGGARFGVLDIEAFTSSAGIFGVSLGVELLATVDLARTDLGTCFWLGLQSGLDAFFFNLLEGNPSLPVKFDITVLIGVRF